MAVPPPFRTTAPHSASWPVSRVLYGGPQSPRDGHSSWAPVAGHLTLPTRATARKQALGTKAPTSPLFGIAPGGVYRAGPVAGPAVGSYPTLSPLPAQYSNAGGRFAFCGTFPGVAPAGRYPAPCFHGARTFLSGGLSALAGAAVRPADGVRHGNGRPARQPRFPAAIFCPRLSRSTSTAEAPARPAGEGRFRGMRPAGSKGRCPLEATP